MGRGKMLMRVAAAAADHVLHLISETHAPAKKDSADDEHGKILSCSVEDDTDTEAETSDEHGGFPAIPPGNRRRKEGGHQTCQVERGSESLQLLVIVLAIGVACVSRSELVGKHVGKEFR